MSTRAQIGVTLACVAVFLCFWGVSIRNHNKTTGPGSDVSIYQQYTENVVLGGRAPYRDFSVEYPPGFLVPMLAPAATSNPTDSSAYAKDFGRWMAGAGVVMILLAAIALVAIRARPTHFVGALGFMAITPFLLGSLMFSRFDLWATALAMGGLAALLSGRDRTGAVLVGAAIATKIWPAVLVPLGLVWIWRRHGRAAALRWLAITVGACAAFFIPFAVLAPAGLGHSFGLQLNRPLQIESLGSAVLLLAHHAGGLAVTAGNSYGSQNLIAHGAQAVSIASALLQVVALCAVWVAFARGPARADRLVAAAAASVTVFIIFGKVFSPQYLIWLIPFVPLVRSRLATLLLGIALVTTQLYFPAHYSELSVLTPWVTWLVLIRDLVVLVLAMELGRVLLEKEPAEEPAPAHERPVLARDPLPS